MILEGLSGAPTLSPFPDELELFRIIVVYPNEMMKSFRKSLPLPPICRPVD